MHTPSVRIRVLTAHICAGSTEEDERTERMTAFGDRTRDAAEAQVRVVKDSYANHADVTNDFFDGPTSMKEMIKRERELNPDGTQAHKMQLLNEQKYGKISQSFNTMGATELLQPSTGECIPIQKFTISVGEISEANKILQLNPPKHPFYNVFGRGVFVETDQTEWRRQRSWLSPGFSTRELQSMLPVMLEEVQHTSRLLQSDSVSIKSRFAQMTMSIICRVSAGVPAEYMRSKAPAVSQAVTLLSEDNFLQIRKGGAKTEEEKEAFQAKMQQAGQEAVSFIGEVLRLAEVNQLGQPSAWAKGGRPEGSSAAECPFGADRPKSLSSLLFKHDELGALDPFAVDNFGIILFAGHITTANSLSWMLYELAKNPAVQAEAQVEVDAWFASQDIACGNEEDDDRAEFALTMRAMKRSFPLVNRVVLETLRKWPPVANGTLRVLQEPTEIGGKMIPRGTPISVPVYRFHHDPQVWPEPARFNPHRPNLKLDNPQFLAFVKGPRNCLGLNLALLEMRLTCVHFLRRFHLRLADPSFEAEALNSITLGPAGRLPIVFEARTGLY
jgi:cytochrome P450